MTCLGTLSGEEHAVEASPGCCLLIPQPPSMQRHGELRLGERKGKSALPAKGTVCV